MADEVWLPPDWTNVNFLRGKIWLSINYPDLKHKPLLAAPNFFRAIRITHLRWAAYSVFSINLALITGQFHGTSPVFKAGTMAVALRHRAHARHLHRHHAVHANQATMITADRLRNYV